MKTKNLFWILISLLPLMSCNTLRKAQISEESIKDFTKTYRNFFTEKELLDSSRVAFISKNNVELIGLPGNTKTLFFEKYFMTEGNWEHIVLPPGTYGKLKSIQYANRKEFFVLQFGEKDTVKYFFELNLDSMFYGLKIKKDFIHQIPPAIKDKYTLADEYPYIDYRGGKYYFISGAEIDILQVDYRFLYPKETILKGFKKVKRRKNLDF